MGNVLNEVVDRVYVINLARRPKRLEAFRAEFQDLEYERFDAVDAQSTEPPSWWVSASGNYACNQSHIGVLRQAMEDGLESVAVFEDDAKYKQYDGLSMNERLRKLFRSLPDNYDGVWLGGRRVMKGKWQCRNLYRAKFLYSRVAYVLRPKGMRIARLHWERTPSSGDWCNLQIMHWARIYHPNPMIVYHPRNFSDTKGKMIAGFR